MPTTDYDDIKYFVENHSYFPMQKLEKILERISSGVVSPVISPRNRKPLWRPTNTSSSLAFSSSNRNANSSSPSVRLRRSLWRESVISSPESSDLTDPKGSSIAARSSSIPRPVRAETSTVLYSPSSSSVDGLRNDPTSDLLTATTRGV